MAKYPIVLVCFTLHIVYADRHMPVGIRGVTDDAQTEFMADSHFRSRRFWLADVIADHMVLQAAPSSFVLWGRAETTPGRLSIAIDGQEIFVIKYEETIHDAEISWRAELAPQHGGGPHNVRISSEFLGSIVIRDVLFGDVFICGGQSNMQMGMQDAYFEDKQRLYHAAADGALNKIRIFTGSAGNPKPSDVLLDKYTTEFHSLSAVHSWLAVTQDSIYGPSCGYWYKSTCFTGTKLQILTQVAQQRQQLGRMFLLHRVSHIWYINNIYIYIYI
jgi:hypothetical protein